MVDFRESSQASLLGIVHSEACKALTWGAAIRDVGFWLAPNPDHHCLPDAGLALVPSLSSMIGRAAVPRTGNGTGPGHDVEGARLHAVKRQFPAPVRRDAAHLPRPRTETAPGYMLWNEPEEAGARFVSLVLGDHPVLPDLLRYFMLYNLT